MNELSLFSGVGGGLLATKWLLGWNCVGYVEWDNYCVKVIEQRIKDGFLSDAPIFHCDIREFNKRYAQAYQGVSCITAGFPCQPFSVAGKQKGADDERNMWPATAEVIEIVRPQRVLLENVPGIRRYLPMVIRDLRRIGYEVRRPFVLGADDVGAPHQRKRVWIIGVDRDIYGGDGHKGQIGKMAEEKNTKPPRVCAEVANTKGARWPSWASKGEFGGCGEMANTETVLLQGCDRRSGQGEFGGNGWWAIEPRLGRVAHGVAHRVDRLKAIGNGQVPAVVKAVWEILMRVKI